jgi:zinc/manganese transport system permease protein
MLLPFRAELESPIWLPGMMSLLLAGILLKRSLKERNQTREEADEPIRFLPIDRIIAISSILLGLGFFVIPISLRFVPILPASISFMAFPFLACLVLTGIHTYLGIHVITREVIFVDLSLAQIAALGTTYAFILGHAPGSTTSYVFSLTFTFIGAAIFALSRLKEREVPQEAIIGIAYASAIALTLLAISRAPHGAEHIKEILTGSILWVREGGIRETAAIYSVVGIFHVVFFRIFSIISTNPSGARSMGINVKFWDFLFYLSFGFVITSSVAIAGVLLVFSFLVIPAVISALFTDRTGKKLIIGWTVGTAVSLFGLLLSYTYDFSSGPAVVSVFGLALVVAALAGRIWFREGSPVPSVSRSRHGIHESVPAEKKHGEITDQ